MQQNSEEIPLQFLAYKSDPKKAESSIKKFNYYLYLIAAIVNLLSFVVGFTGVWVTPVLPKLNQKSSENPFGRPITASEIAWVAGLTPLGAALGPLGAGKITNIIGRKGALLVIAFLLIFSFSITVFANSISWFYIARFIAGVALGCSYATLSVFFAEISENHNRGALGCSMAIFIALGLNFALIVGPYLTIRNFSLVCICPLVIFIPCFYYLCPETPPFLASMNKEKKLAASLLKLRNKTPEEIHLEYVNLLESAQKNQTSTTICDLFRTPHLRRGLVICLGLSTIQQGVGVGAILSYLQTIFEAANAKLKPEFCVMIVGSFQLLGTILSFCTVDRAGRRLLLFSSCCGIFLSLTSLSLYFHLKSNNFQVDAVSWLPLLSITVLIVSYGLGVGPVPWVVMAELFESSVKPVAATIVSFTCFMAMFLGTVVFPILSLSLGVSKCFFMFAVISFVGCVFIYCMVPETKGKSVQQIQNLLARSHK